MGDLRRVLAERHRAARRPARRRRRPGLARRRARSRSTRRRVGSLAVADLGEARGRPCARSPARADRARRQRSLGRLRRSLPRTPPASRSPADRQRVAAAAAPRLQQGVREQRQRAGLVAEVVEHRSRQPGLEHESRTGRGQLDRTAEVGRASCGPTSAWWSLDGRRQRRVARRSGRRSRRAARRSRPTGLPGVAARPAACRRSAGVRRRRRTG